MTGTVTIRPGRHRGIAPFDALYARCYPNLLKADYPPTVLVLALPLISRVRSGLITCGTYFVAEVAEEAILGAGAGPRVEASRDRAMGFTALGPIEVELRAGIGFPAIQMQYRLIGWPTP